MRGKGQGLLSQPPQAVKKPSNYQGNQNFFPQGQPQLGGAGVQQYMGQVPQAMQPNQGQPQRVSPGVYRNADGSLQRGQGNHYGQMKQQQRPMQPAMQGQGQFQRPMPSGQIDNGGMMPGQFQQPMQGQFQRPAFYQYQPQFGQQPQQLSQNPQMQNMNYMPFRNGNYR